MTVPVNKSLLHKKSVRTNTLSACKTKKMCLPNSDNSFMFLHLLMKQKNTAKLKGILIQI